jgi:2-dehydropantoate 2-reductase
MRIAIIGAGSLGSAVAGLLNIAVDVERDGADPLDVWLVGSASVSGHLDAIREHGLALELAEYLPQQLPSDLVARFWEPIRTLHVTEQAQEAFPCDIAIVLVKSYRSEAAGAQAAQLLTADGLLISVQNGIGNDVQLAKHVPSERLIMGTTLLGARTIADGQIRIASLNPSTLAWPSQVTERQQSFLLRLQELLGHVHAPVNFAEDVQRVLWTKLVINCAINPLTAMLDVPNGFVIEDMATHAMMVEVIREALIVARAVGVELPTEIEMIQMAENAAESNRANLSSMLQDRRRGKRTEIDALNGALVQRAREHQLSVPINESLVHLIHALEVRYGISAFS